MTHLFIMVEQCLQETDINTKIDQARLIQQLWCAGELEVDDSSAMVERILSPGCPNRPTLVHPSALAKRSMGSPAGHAALIHAIAHIEFNAINLALDAVYRFQEMPATYYGDWIDVAVEEAYHFNLLQTYLQDLGYQYGDFDAHSGLWDMAMKTSDDILSRMALVPRFLEARGLDVTPAMIAKLQSHQYHRAAEILQIIYQDEIGHVAIGSRWFQYICQQRGLEAESAFIRLLERYLSGPLRGPLNYTARQQAGFSQIDLHNLDEMVN